MSPLNTNSRAASPSNVNQRQSQNNSPKSSSHIRSPSVKLSLISGLSPMNRRSRFRNSLMSRNSILSINSIYDK
jgi:hypothetical protein